MRWRYIPIPDQDDGEKFRIAIRLNALGSLYFFIKHVLQRDWLTDGLHKPILTKLETDIPRYLLEMPRDHLKTVMVTEGRTMWRALPFNDIDEALMRAMGYDDDWIRWMRSAHRPERRTLTVSEIIGNAVMIGSRIDWHYKENQWFRFAFPEVIPDNSCTWTENSKTHKCASRGPQGEGTYDFLGVGGALQSRHYDDANEDDVIGKDAIESELIMEKTINYHRLLIGAFADFKSANWTVVNNRWAPNDLSGWIREHQKEFVIESHSALGGCCDAHPADTPIFPEKFSRAILEQIREIQGPYYFSHQYLNLAVNPEECIFNRDWLRFYAPVESPVKAERHWLRHTVKDGETIKDIDPNILIRSMIVDPNHAEERGRCHHGVVVTGLDPEADRVYLLDVWAKSSSYDELINQIFEMGQRWNLPEFWLETIAAQRLLRYPVEYRNKLEASRTGVKRGWQMSIRELKTDRGANAKRTRIEALEPIFRDGRFWVRHDQSAFLDEYYNYPGGRTVDVLDCLGYAVQTWNAIHARRILDVVKERKERWAVRRNTITGY
jgi:hypothetical protein